MSIIIPANSAVGGGYDVDNSVRFNGASSDDLTGTPSGTPTSRYKGTLSVWLKRSAIDEEDFIFYGLEGSANRMKITFKSDNKLQINTIQAGSNNLVYETNRLFRDVSAWYHIVIAIDTTLGTAGDRCRLYVNGVEETSFSTETDFSQNAITFMSETNIPVYIGSQSTGNYYDGYMAEYVLIDGQQLAPTSFGEFDEDSGIWKPIDVSGLTFGTNGFYLEFKQSGTGTNASGMGADTSGNTNHFAVNNLTAIDQTTDTPTNNFATLNPLGMPSTNTTFSEGNLTVNVASGSSFWSVPTIGVSSGKWYVEGKLVTGTASSGVTYSDYGFADRSDSAGQALYSSSARVFWLSAWDSKINYRTGGSTTAGLQTGKTGLSQGDFFQLYLDMDNELMYWGRNGSVTNSTGVSFNGKESQTGEYFFAFGDQFTNGTYKYSTNFGQGSIDGSAAANYNDANGFGNFKYNPTVTTDEGSKDFLALCTKNLAEYG